jgi:hypothetical protein
MRKILLLPLICLLLTGCTIGIVRRVESTPTALPPTPTCTVQQTSTPTTQSPEPTQPPTPSPTLLAPTPSPIPTAFKTPAPTAVEEASTGPAILYFRSSVEEADPGDTVVLEWASTGATKAILCRIPPSYHMPQSGWDVDPTGTFAYQIPSDERNWTVVQLYVFDEAENYAVASLTILLRCLDPWFFSPAPDVCPTAPIVSQAAEQHFERGTMIWVKELDRIYVLYEDINSPKWQAFPDDWDESLPESDPSIVPPEGLQQPIRGFGLVWRQNPTVRERLGWAVDREMGFETIVQHTTLYKYNSTYLRALDGNIYHLGPEQSSWEKIEIE